MLHCLQPDHQAKVNIREIRPGHRGIGHVCLSKEGACKVHPGEESLAQVRAIHKCSTTIGPIQIGFIEVCDRQIRAGEIGILHRHTPEGPIHEQRIDQRGPAKVAIREICIAKNRIRQKRIAQIDLGEPDAFRMHSRRLAAARLTEVSLASLR